MAKRTVVWTNTASLQLREILKFWIENNQTNTYALKLLDKVERNIDGILRNPKRCPKSVFKDTRVSAMTHYSIFYKVSDQHIVVMAFWDNRQDPKLLHDILAANQQ